jgi:cell division protein YceG involved in septum cleavage
VQPPTCSRAGSPPNRVRVTVLSRGDRSRPQRERTSEERERDREERERQRAQREGGAVEPPQPVAADSPVPVAADPPAPEAIDPPVAPEQEAADPPAAEPEPIDLPALEPEPIDPPMPEAIAAPPLEPIDPPALPPAPASFGLASRPRAHRGRRSGPARVGALIALLAALAAVALLVRTLVRSGAHTPTLAAPKVVKLLIPEGKTRAQIAELAKAAGLTGSYRLASRRSPLLNPVQYGAPRDTPDLEGFLFPATYDLNPGEPASRLVQEQLIAFRENFGHSQIAAARALHVTPYELLTVASMVEREAQVPGDRAKIAAVIYNRLKRGIPLGIDATIYYAVEQRKGVATYTKELTEADLHIHSPYNTRTHTGLPPTPIANPGVASIQAAAHPAHVSYLYYVAAADGCGEQLFSTTQAAFEANAAAYAAAVSKNGGRPPSCKHKR